MFFILVVWVDSRTNGDDEPKLEVGLYKTWKQELASSVQTYALDIDILLTCRNHVALLSATLNAY